MYTTKEIQEEILKLKKEKDVCVLAHAYQTHDVLEIADFTGDSFGLSRQAAKAPQKTILMCGVRFMAETVKILSPEKRVLVSHSEAVCPMAQQLSANELKKLREKYPDAAVVAYINTTAELKTQCDACVTSSSAMEVVRRLPQKEILFIPDCNLGAWLEERLPEKQFHFIKGGCPVHMQITAEDVKKARKAHPAAQLLVHPECLREVSGEADFVGSTTEIMHFAGKSDCNEFIIGTDTSIVTHLQFEYPQKRFYPLSKECVCKDMRLTTLCEVLNCLQGTGGEEIILPQETIEKARESIDVMLG